MNAIALLLIGLGAFGLGYVVYSRFIASRSYALDDSRPTPAHVGRHLDVQGEQQYP